MTEVQEIAERFEKPFPAGEIIFKQGDAGETMFVVQRGRVQLTQSTRNGERHLAQLSVGDFFGEMAILNHKPRSATAIAIDDVRLLVIDRNTFEGMVLENAEIALRLVRRFAKRVDDANELIDILLHRDPKARLILGLAREADLRGIDCGDGSVIVPSSDVALATQLGLDVQAVADSLAHLAKLQIVTPHKQGLLVRDLNRLTEFLDQGAR